MLKWICKALGLGPRAPKRTKLVVKQEWYRGELYYQLYRVEAGREHFLTHSMDREVIAKAIRSDRVGQWDSVVSDMDGDEFLSGHAELWKGAR